MAWNEVADIAGPQGPQGDPGGTPLSTFMTPSSMALYPPADVVSYTRTTTNPAYTGQQTIAFNAADAALRYRYAGTWTNLSNNGVNAINGATTSTNNSYTSWEVEFFVNGADVTIWSVSLFNTDYRIFVDDMPLTADWELTPSGTTANYIKIQFATSRVRKIRFLGSAVMSLTGILMPGTSDIWAAPPRFRAAVIGDSFIQGMHNAGDEGIMSAAALCNQLAIMTGWEVINLGQGSTGYVHDAANANGKDFYGATSRMNALAALPELDLIMTFGSGNDSGYTASAVTTAANSLWDAIKAARPTTPIVVAGVEPGSPSSFNTTLLDSTNAALKAAALANDNVAGFIDMRTDNWVTGTGNVGATQDNGSADFFTSSDTIHPSRAGYYNLAWRMVRELREIFGLQGDLGVEMGGISGLVEALADKQDAAAAVSGSNNGTPAAMTVWVGTEAQYTAIGSKDSATLYFRSA